MTFARLSERVADVLGRPSSEANVEIENTRPEASGAALLHSLIGESSNLIANSPKHVSRMRRGELCCKDAMHN